MKKKKVVIFESIKGAGKTILLNELKNHLKDSVFLGEEITLKPIKHFEDKNEILDHYKNIINEIENYDYNYFLLDRFHYTKWPTVNYESDYFKEIEELLLSKFEVIFIFLEIDKNVILERLNHTQEHRKPTGWKLNYDGISIEDEAEKDVNWQSFFLEHQYRDTLIDKKIIINTTDLHLNLNNLDLYVKQIINILR